MKHKLRKLEYGSDCMYTNWILNSKFKIPFKKESDWPARLGNWISILLLDFFGLQSAAHICWWYISFHEILDRWCWKMADIYWTNAKQFPLEIPSCLLLSCTSPPVWVGRMLICRSRILGVSVGEAEEVILVQVHDDQLVRWSQIHWHLGEFLVKVTSVSTAPLQVWRVMVERDGQDNKVWRRMEWIKWEKKRKHQLSESVGRKTSFHSTGS